MYKIANFSIVNKLYVKINSITKEFLEHIDNGHHFKKDDLFVVIEYGEQKRQTTVKKDTLTPQWNEEFLFDINPSKNILCKIYDFNSWSKNELLDEIIISFDEKITNIENRLINIDIGYVKVCDLHKHNEKIHDAINIIGRL